MHTITKHTLHVHFVQRVQAPSADKQQANNKKFTIVYIVLVACMHVQIVCNLCFRYPPPPAVTRLMSDPAEQVVGQATERTN